MNMTYLILAGQVIFLSISFLLLQRGDYGSASGVLLLIPGLPFVNDRANPIVMYTSWFCVLAGFILIAMLLFANN